MNKEKENKWYALETNEILKILQSDINAGIAEKEVKDRLMKYGENILPQKKKRSAIIRFLAHFDDILIYVLFIAGIISAILGHYLDTIVYSLLR